MHLSVAGGGARQDSVVFLSTMPQPAVRAELERYLLERGFQRQEDFFEKAGSRVRLRFEPGIQGQPRVVVSEAR